MQTFLWLICRISIFLQLHLSTAQVPPWNCVGGGPSNKDYVLQLQSLASIVAAPGKIIFFCKKHHFFGCKYAKSPFFQLHLSTAQVPPWNCVGGGPSDKEQMLQLQWPASIMAEPADRRFEKNHKSIPWLMEIIVVCKKSFFSAAPFHCPSPTMKLCWWWTI